MRFEPSAYSAETGPLFRRFIEIAPWPIWEKRISTFKEWCRNNPLMHEFIIQRYPLEIQMMLISAQYQTEKVLPPPDEDSIAYRLFAFVSMVARVLQRLSVKGRRRLQQCILDGLKDDKGLAPLAFEMSMAGELMHRGFDVVGTERPDPFRKPNKQPRTFSSLLPHR